MSSDAGSTATSDRVAELINNGLLDAEASQRIVLLKQVQELIVNKEPALLDNFFEEILQFQLDRNADVRQQLVAFVEAAATKDQRLLPKAVPALNYLLQDDSSKVAKKVVQAAASLHRLIFDDVARRGGAALAEALWQSTLEMKEQILALRSTQNDGVRTAVIKYIEMLVLLYSFRTRGTDSKKAVDASLDIVPLSHPFLQLDPLREEGQAYMSTLIETPRADYTSSSGCLAVVGSLVSIARQRPTFLSRVCSCMVGLAQEPPKQLKPAQVNSLKRTLKTQMLALLKHPDSARFHETMIPALEDLGADPMEISVHDRRAEVRSRGIGRDAGAAAAGVKRPADDDAAKQGAEKRAKEEPAPPYLTHSVLTALPLPAVVELVMRSLSNLPEVMPASLSNDGTATPASAFAARASKAVRDPRKAAAAAAREEGAGVGAEQPGGETLQDEKVVPALPNPSAAPAPARRQPALQPVARKSQRFVLKSAPLDAETRSMLLVGAFRRMLDNSERLTEAGADRARLSLICRMASMQQLYHVGAEQLAAATDPMSSALLEHLSADIRSRVELAIVWLYHEFYLTRGELDAVAEGADPPQAATAARRRYEACVQRLLQTVGPQLEARDRLFLRLVVEMPSVTYCEDSERVYLGVATLRDLILMRPPSREQCLPVLLALTQHATPVVRAQSIQVCKKLHGHATLSETVDGYAAAQLQRLLQPCHTTAEGEEQQWDDALISSHASLYLALMAQKADMLTGLVQVYTHIPPSMKMIILRSLHSAIKAIGAENSTLQALISECPDGADTLILKAVHIVTDKVKPSPAIVSLVQKLYEEKIKDARFLIPIVNGLSRGDLIKLLPQFISLPGKGWTEVLMRLLGSDYGKSPISPAELLVALHQLDPARDNVPMKAIMVAITTCFGRRDVYKHDVLAVGLQQLLELSPLPILLMRTVIQTLQLSPRLKGFVVREILTRLISKEVWRHPALWQGFVKCIQQVQPDSMEVLRLLPAEQLKDILRQPPSMHDAFVKYLKALPAFTRARLPPAVLEIVGDELDAA